MPDLRATATACDLQSTLAVTGRPRQLHPLVLGYEPISEAFSVDGGNPMRWLLEPVTACIVTYDDGWVLLDSGFNVDTVRDPAARAAHYNFDSYTAVVPPGDPLPDAVSRLGLRWEDCAGCALSHLHCDHTGGLRLLGDGPPVVLQRDEWAFGTTEATVADAYFRDDYTSAALDVCLVEGDAELAPGLTAISTAGHTPGHQSFAVDLVDSGTIVLACDAADLRVGITSARRCSCQRPGFEAAAQASIERLAALDGKPSTQVWPGHDPDWWPWRAARRPVLT